MSVASKAELYPRDAYSPKSRGERLAFVSVPLIATLLWYFVTLLHLAFLNGRIRWGPDIVAMAIGAVVWGFPIACAATLFAAMPLHVFLRRADPLSFTTTALSGIGIGLCLAVAVAAVTGELWSSLFSPTHGIVVGFLAAVGWSYLAGRVSTASAATPRQSGGAD
jgi:hypothetical protein